MELNLTERLPKLRFNITFDLDLNTILEKFKTNSSQSILISVKCCVEKLSK